MDEEAAESHCRAQDLQGGRGRGRDVHTIQARVYHEPHKGQFNSWLCTQSSAVSNNLHTHARMKYPFCSSREKSDILRKNVWTETETEAVNWREARVAKKEFSVI